MYLQVIILYVLVKTVLYPDSVFNSVTICMIGAIAYNAIAPLT